MKNDIVVVAWNGSDEPLKHIDFDLDFDLDFNLILFNYSGNDKMPELPSGKSIQQLISVKTEFKGELLYQVCKHVQETTYRYIGLLDDDQSISVSSINSLLRTAEKHGFDVFHPSIADKSYCSYDFFKQRKGIEFEYVAWVEIMAPFYRKAVFEAGFEFYKDNISSYGIDCYLIPFLQRKLSLTKTALVHTVAVAHLKPVTDASKIFSNGFDARQEMEKMRLLVLSRIKSEKIHFDGVIFKQLFHVGLFRWEKWKFDIKRFLQRKKILNFQ